MVGIDFAETGQEILRQIEEGRLEMEGRWDIVAEAHLETWEAHLEIEDLVGIEGVVRSGIGEARSENEAEGLEEVDRTAVGVQKADCWDTGAYLED